MNILFLYKNFLSPSFIFYKKSLEKFDKFKIFFSNDLQEIKKKNYDFIFVLSGFNYEKIKDDLKIKKSILFEPRFLHYNCYDIFDAIVHNGLESEISLTKYKKRSFIYPPYPEYDIKKNKEKKDDVIRLLYHGNKIHLMSIQDKLNFFIRTYNSRYNLEINLIYNHSRLGVVQIKKYSKKITTQYFNYSDEIMKKFLSISDIGLVPQLIPIQRKFFTNMVSSSILKIFNENSSDYLLKFKNNSNLGRHLVFAQSEIPIISDATISSLNFIEHGINGYIFNDKFSFCSYLLELISNKDTRKRFGQNLYSIYKEKFSHQVLNKNLMEFLKIL